MGNFHQVDVRIYRGAQPTARGFQALAVMGIKTIVDLREPGKRAGWEKKVVEAAGMRYVNIPLNPMGAPQPEKVKKILAIFADTSAGPVFIHCRRGADRTGTMVACYRISHDGWKNRKALDEAHTCGMHWFEFGMKNYVLGYQVDRGETAPPAAPATAIAVN